MAIVLQNELSQFINDIWGSFLKLPLSQSDKTFKPEGQGNTLASCIHITGAWHGSVTLYCSTDLAKKISTAMTSIPMEDLTFEEIQDVMGEIVNMVAGNVKSLLPQPSTISLPSVAITDFDLRIPKTEMINTVTFECAQNLFLLSLLQEKDGQ